MITIETRTGPNGYVRYDVTTPSGILVCENLAELVNTLQALQS